MSKDHLYKLWNKAYVDLHVAYLGVLAIRHQRRKDATREMRKDMGLLDPFSMDSPSGPEAVQRWYDLWDKHEGADEKVRPMAAATEAIQDHWASWSDLMDVCPPALKKFRIPVPEDSFVTSTAASREALEHRAKVLQEAWKLLLKYPD